MTNAQHTLLRRLNAPITFTSLQNFLFEKFQGDEGHDIGDASNIIELIAKVCDEGTHDSYTPTECADAVSEFFVTDPADMMRDIFATVRKMNVAEYLNLLEEYP